MAAKAPGKASKPKQPSFRRFRAARRIRLAFVIGAPEHVIEADATVETDGETVRLPGGRCVSSPTLLGAIAVGWLIPLDEPSGS